MLTNDAWELRAALSPLWVPRYKLSLSCPEIPNVELPPRSQLPMRRGNHEHAKVSKAVDRCACLDVYSKFGPGCRFQIHGHEDHAGKRTGDAIAYGANAHTDGANAVHDERKHGQNGG